MRYFEDITQFTYFDRMSNFSLRQSWACFSKRLVCTLQRSVSSRTREVKNRMFCSYIFRNTITSLIFKKVLLMHVRTTKCTHAHTPVRLHALTHGRPNVCMFSCTSVPYNAHTDARGLVLVLQSLKVYLIT